MKKVRLNTLSGYMTNQNKSHLNLAVYKAGIYINYLGLTQVSILNI